MVDIQDLDEFERNIGFEPQTPSPKSEVEDVQEKGRMLGFENRDFLSRAFQDPVTIISFLMGIVSKIENEIYKEFSIPYIQEIFRDQIESKDPIILKAILLCFIAVEHSVQNALKEIYKDRQEFINLFIDSVKNTTKNMIVLSYDKYNTYDILTIYTTNFANCWCNNDSITLQTLADGKI